MAFNDNQIQQAWIQEQLDIYGEELIDILVDAIEQKELVASGQLVSSFSMSTDRSAQRLVVSFLSYGRVHDLKSRNSSMTFETVDTNALLWGVKKRKPRKSNRNKTWYSKNFYSSLNTIIGRLMYGFSQEARQEIKAMLEKSESLKSTFQ